MEYSFRKVIENIFNNWTALILAVENGMGGPNSKQTANECMEYMVQYCLYEPNVNESDIMDALEDILDQEFSTICEDNSPREIAKLLFKFLSLLKENNLIQFEIEYNGLPKNRANIVQNSHNFQQESEPSTSQIEDNEVMEDLETNSSKTSNTKSNGDLEWTEVKSRRKR